MMFLKINAPLLTGARHAFEHMSKFNESIELRSGNDMKYAVQGFRQASSCKLPPHVTTYQAIAWLWTITTGRSLHPHTTA
mmetsp:Transcript_7276/g.15060  ORF Transcript_7276/g.15060 Transcript_7276/m.15060 type:complete len:80 (-) Transcript_7276:266-505(-)